MCIKRSIICILVLISLTCSQVRGSVCTDGGGVNIAAIASAAATDSAGHIFVVGSINLYQYKPHNNYTLTIAGKVFGESPIQNTGYIAKIQTATNTAMWVKYITLYHPAQQPSATVDSVAADGNQIYISGQFWGSVSVFGCELQSDINKGGVYIASLSEAGACTGSLVVNGNYFETVLQVEPDTHHLYLYAPSVYGAVTFGTHTFSADSAWAMFIAKITNFNFDWVEQIQNIVEGETQDIFATEDFSTDDNQIYTVIEGLGTLRFCNAAMSCSIRNFTGTERVLVGLSKSNGAVTTTSLKLNLEEYNVLNVATRSAATGTQVYVSEIGQELLVSRYNAHGHLVWAVSIPNNYTQHYRQLESLSVGIRLQGTGVFVGGTTDTGSGAQFVTDQPWIAKLSAGTGAVVFNTRADISIANPPDRFSYAGNVAIGDDQVFLVGAFGCTLKFGDKKLKSDQKACSFGAPDGRNTDMYVISVDSTTGLACGN